MGQVLVLELISPAFTDTVHTHILLQPFKKTQFFLQTFYADTYFTDTLYTHTNTDTLHTDTDLHPFYIQ